jgi:hypothetical protein
MKVGRQSELQCPRCQVLATRPPGHQKVCTHCGARLVPAQSPSEDRVRAYLYGGDDAGPTIRPLDDHEGALR